MPANQTPNEVLAQAHQASLTLLGAVAEYLRRLPVNPLTHAMIRQVESHLEQPLEVANRTRLKAIADQVEFHARVTSGNAFKGFSGFTPVGLPIIACKLQYPDLLLSSPALSALKDPELRESAAASIARQLSAGVTIKLDALDPLADRDWHGHQQSTD